jgi:DNA ligase-1
VITFRYQELSDGGVPRFPSYIGVRQDATLATSRPAIPEPVHEASPPADSHIPVSTTTRRFELVEGSASKFWEVARDRCSVTVRFGRIGTRGQAQTKDFATDEAASRHAAKLIDEKVAKGYRECGEA